MTLTPDGELQKKRRARTGRQSVYARRWWGEKSHWDEFTGQSRRTGFQRGVLRNKNGLVWVSLVSLVSQDGKGPGLFFPLRLPGLGWVSQS